MLDYYNRESLFAKLGFDFIAGYTGILALSGNRWCYELVLPNFMNARGVHRGVAGILALMLVFGETALHERDLHAE